MTLLDIGCGWGAACCEPSRNATSTSSADASRTGCPLEQLLLNRTARDQAGAARGLERFRSRWTGSGDRHSSTSATTLRPFFERAYTVPRARSRTDHETLGEEIIGPLLLTLKIVESATSCRRNLPRRRLHHPDGEGHSAKRLQLKRRHRCSALRKDPRHVGPRWSTQSEPSRSVRRGHERYISTHRCADLFAGATSTSTNNSAEVVITQAPESHAVPDHDNDSAAGRPADDGVAGPAVGEYPVEADARTLTAVLASATASSSRAVGQ